MDDRMLMNVLNCLEKYKEKPIALKQKGFVSSQFYIKKLVYGIENDILTMQMETGEEKKISLKTIF